MMLEKSLRMFVISRSCTSNTITKSRNKIVCIRFQEADMELKYRP